MGLYNRDFMRDSVGPIRGGGWRRRSWSVVGVGMVVCGLVFAGQLIQLRERTPDYTKVAGKIFQWSITYLSLLSVLLVVAQLLKA